jgi:hypothetical protein
MSFILLLYSTIWLLGLSFAMAHTHAWPTHTRHKYVSTTRTSRALVPDRAYHFSNHINNRFHDNACFVRVTATLSRWQRPRLSHVRHVMSLPIYPWHTLPIHLLICLLSSANQAAPDSVSCTTKNRMPCTLQSFLWRNEGFILHRKRPHPPFAIGLCEARHNPCNLQTSTRQNRAGE